MFAPEAMHAHKTTVVVSCCTTEEKGEGGTDRLNLEWQFPIVGVPEIRPVSPKSAPKIACRAKERVEEKLEMELVGCKMSRAAIICRGTPNGESPTSSLESVSNNYTYQLVCSDNEHSSLIENSVGLKLLNIISDKSDPVKLVFGIVFIPPKAFRCISFHLRTYTNSNQDHMNNNVWMPKELAVHVRVPALFIAQCVADVCSYEMAIEL